MNLYSDFGYYEHEMENHEMIYYNFCFQIEKPHELCNVSYAVRLNADSSQCDRLTTGEIADLANFVLSPLDTDLPSLGVRVQMKGGAYFKSDYTAVNS